MTVNSASLKFLGTYFVIIIVFHVLFWPEQVNLATSGLKNVPPAFHMPDEKEKLLEYAR
jgi:hypothetical protein